MKSEMLNSFFSHLNRVVNVAGVISNAFTSVFPEGGRRAIRLLGVFGRREYVITFSCSLLHMLAYDSMAYRII